MNSIVFWYDLRERILSTECDRIDPTILPIDKWLSLARAAKADVATELDQVKASKFVSRVQCLLVEHGLISDDEFMQSIERKPLWG